MLRERPSEIPGEELPPGTRLGKYWITGKLGQGGTGTVHAGEDRRLRRAVAIKMLAPQFARNPQWLQRFLLEARAAARLHHPHVVTVFDIGQRNGVYYLVMELLSGGSVQGQLQAHGRFVWIEATRIIAEVCRGLGAAHAAGLIHRDVKPANILLTADKTAKLADFGFAKAPDLVPLRLTRLGTIVGTPQYMSPEQCAAEELDERSDLYALGATYFTLLTGRPPYDQIEPLQLLYAHCTAPVPDPRQHDASLPPECAAIIARAMAKKRIDRYRSAQEMLAPLQYLLMRETATVVRALPSPAPAAPAAAPATTEVSRVQPVARRRLPRKLIVLSGILAVTVGVALCSYLAQPTPVVSQDTPESSSAPSLSALAAERFHLKPRSAPRKGHTRTTAIAAGAGRIASAGSEGKVLLWPLDGSKNVRILHHECPLTAVALSQDGRLVAAGGSPRCVYLWDAASGEQLTTLSDVANPISALAFSPSGKQLAVACYSDLLLYEIDSPKRIRRRGQLLKQEYYTTAVAFSGDGKRLAACTRPGKVFVWDLERNQRKATPGEMEGQLTSIACSRDGSQVVFGTHHGMLYLWEPDRGTPPIMLAPREGSIAAVAFAPGRDTVAFGGAWGGPLILLDRPTGSMVRVPGLPDGLLTSLCFTPDSRVLAAGGSDGSVRLWDIE